MWRLQDVVEFTTAILLPSRLQRGLPSHQLSSPHYEVDFDSVVGRELGHIYWWRALALEQCEELRDPQEIDLLRQISIAYLQYFERGIDLSGVGLSYGEAARRTREIRQQSAPVTAPRPEPAEEAPESSPLENFETPTPSSEEYNAALAEFELANTQQLLALVSNDLSHSVQPVSDDLLGDVESHLDLDEVTQSFRFL